MGLHMMLMLTAVAAGALAAPVTVSLGAATSTIADEFISFALDLSAGKHDWNRFNLKDPGTLNLLRQLRPAVLRVSGTAVDYSHFVAQPSQRLRGGDGGQWNLTAQALGHLCDFATAIQWDFVLGLNAQLGYNQSAAHPWNDGNALELMRFVNRTACPVMGYELGNELNLGAHQAGKGVFTPQLQASHVDTLTTEALPSQYPALGGGSPSSPLVLGPDVTQSGVGPDGRAAYFLRDFLSSFGPSDWGVDRVTWHQYQKPAHDVSWYVNPKNLDVVQALTADAAAAFRAYAKARTGAGRPAPQLWLGETGIELNSSDEPDGPTGNHVPGLDDGFAGALAFGDKLGLAMRNAHSVVVQQQLPHLLYQTGPGMSLQGTAPSVVMSSVWKRLAGTTVLSVAGDTAPGRVVRSYAVCSRQTKGAAAVVVINTDKEAADVTIEGGGPGDWSVFQLAPFPDKGDYKSQSIGINGDRADIAESGDLPQLKPTTVPAGTVIQVLGRTMAFVEVSSVAACS